MSPELSPVSAPEDRTLPKWAWKKLKRDPKKPLDKSLYKVYLKGRSAAESPFCWRVSGRQGARGMRQSPQASPVQVGTSKHVFHRKHSEKEASHGRQATHEGPDH